MFQKIRRRIAVPYILLIFAMMSGLLIYFPRLVRDSELAEQQASLLDKAQIVAGLVEPILESAADEDLDGLAGRWAQSLQAQVTILDESGRVLGDSAAGQEVLDNQLLQPEIQQAIADGRGNSLRYSTSAGTEIVFGALRVTNPSGQIVGYVRTGLPLTAVEADVRQFQAAILTATLLAVAAAALLSIIIGERTARPIRRLTEVAGRVADGDLDARLYLNSRDEVGQLAQAFNQMADQLRQQVTTLTAEQGRLAAVLENMADGVLITDSMGRVSLINPAAARLLEVDLESSIGRTFAEVARHHRLIELWQQGCGQPEEEVGIVELSRQGLFLQMIVTSLATGGRSSCLVILQDLTRIRRLETVRRDFISNISHELRTPLASLKALVETLRDGALEDPPAAHRFLDRAEEEVDALTQLVQELLELSRIESGQVPLRLEPTPVSEVILPAVERLRSQAERNGLLLEVDLPADLPPVLVDARRVQQVVGNLVHNAIKFTPEKGKISIRAEVKASDQTVVIRVSDTGVGMPAAEQSRIFERFYKADRARSGGGTGLGLAIARHLVQAHGGQIWLKSKEGQGSTFYFSLPIA
jgi:two-component system, OmpR family, phosphate regulon sensor histidine kinase PhoR